MAFNQEEERHQMRDTRRQLFGLAIQYMSRTRDYEPVLREGRRVGGFYGQQCARHDISLVDAVRALFLFRKTLLTAATPDQASPGQYDAEDVRLHWQLQHFLDKITNPCLASYEAASRHLLQVGATL